jgi:superfamily I DNA and/or RNA helicase
LAPLRAIICRWCNDRETKAVIEILAAHRATNFEKPPTLAVLSPYLQQVRRLNEAIDEHWNGHLKHISDFSFAVPAGKGICGTVDSFQGNEADLVIVSLVRNNHHSNVRNALGFLTDFRRMNVLLSRARWRLVLVGSRDFLETIIKSVKGTAHEDEIKFLELFLQALAEEEKDQMAVTISEASLQGLAR